VPEAYLDQVRGFLGHHPEFYLLVGVYTGYSQFNAVDRDFPVGIGRSLFFNAEDILRGFKGDGHLERTEEMAPLSDGSLKPDYRYLSCGTVDLMLVVAVDFVVQHVPRPVDGSDAFPGTGPHYPVLEPPVRPLDLPFCLGRQRVGYLHPAFFHDPLPLRIRFVGLQIVLLPDGISSLNEPEDRMAVHVVGKRDAVRKPYRLKRHDMVPSMFSFYNIRIEEVTAVIIDAGDEVPLLVRVGGPAVMGGIVLNQLAGIVGDYLSIMVLPFGLLEIEAPFLALSIMVGTYGTSS